MSRKQFYHRRRRKVWVAVTKRGKLLCIGATKDVAQSDGREYEGYAGTIQTWVDYWDDDFEPDDYYWL